jgi:methionyl-tRNA formyltransferase
MTRAIVFAYHNVGVHCLSVLLAHKVDVALLVTHQDNPTENIWFASVAKLAAEHGVPAITPEDPNTDEIVEQIRALQPDFLFSFYYRNMLKRPLLALPARGALNMHGSLLPKYRGRVPVNWAVIKGETETGATLHYMTEKPDAGDIVGQEVVPILPDDTAFDVFNKVTDAAAAVLHCHLPALIAGNAPRNPQDLTRGSYFSGRKAEDGRIDWTQSATSVHNLVRGVAPPYPGAFTEIDGSTLKILRTRIEPGRSGEKPQSLRADKGGCLAVCADGSVLRILEMQLEGQSCTPQALITRFGTEPLSLKSTPT